MSKNKSTLSQKVSEARRRAGKAGGAARAKALNAEERKKIATMGGAATKRKYDTNKKIGESLKETLSQLTLAERSALRQKPNQTRYKKMTPAERSALTANARAKRWPNAKTRLAERRSEAAKKAWAKRKAKL